MDEPARTVSVSIELAVGDEPVAGTISVRGGERREFVGWMQLVHAIDVARGAASPAPPIED